MADERPPLPDFYAVLGVGFDATNDELRQAWRTAVKQWHPDTNRSPEAHGMMTRINEAWEVLGDPERRAEYDTLYFTLRAAIANEERKLREEERLERQRQERIRQQERERQRRAEEAARKRAEEEEQRRKEQARKERERREAEARRKAEREKREKERKEREQRERERRAAEARRKADLERKRREQERINREREEQERAERLRRQREAEGDNSLERNREPGMPSGPPGGTANGRGRGGSVGGRAAWGLAIVGLAALIAVVGVFVANRIEEQNASDRAAARVVPTARLYHTPTPRPTPVPTATPTPTAVPTATPTATPAPTPMPTVTPIPAIIYVTATPTVTPDPDLDWVEYIEPGSVHEYLLLSDNPTGADVRRLIAAGAEFGYIDDIGFGSLFMAVVTGAGADVVTALLDAGDDLASNPQLLHALMWSDNPTVEVARVLIEAGADVLHRDHNGQTPLDIAIVRIEVPQDVYEVIKDATMAAREQVRVAATPTMMPTATAVPTVTPTMTPTSVPTATPVPTPSSTPEPTAAPTPTATREPSATPTPTTTPTPKPSPTATPSIEPNEVATKALWSALHRDYRSRPTQDEILYLIGLGADVSVPDSRGLTMFEYAVSRGDDRKLVELLSPGLSAEAATGALWSALHRDYRSRPTHGEVLYLIGLGADVSVPDSRGLTMFEYAVSRGDDRKLVVLLSAGLSAEAATGALWSALRRDYRSRPTHDEVLYLIGLGADVSAPDSRGLTMFEYAVSRHDDREVVSLLSTDLSAEAATGALWSALHRDYRSRPTRDEVVFLISLGADVSVPDSRGVSMFEYAVGRGDDREIVELLLAEPVETTTATPTLGTPPRELTLRGSGTLYSVVGSGLIGCARSTDEPAFIASNATYGAVEFSFEVPSVSAWGIGLFYHKWPAINSNDAATYVYRTDESGIRAGHWTRVQGEQIVTTSSDEVDSAIFDSTIGALNKVSIVVANDGSALRLNGIEVLRVPSSELVPRASEMQVCIGFSLRETQDYLIDYIDLRAWAE